LTQARPSKLQTNMNSGLEGASEKGRDEEEEEKEEEGEEEVLEGLHGPEEQERN